MVIKTNILAIVLVLCYINIIEQPEEINMPQISLYIDKITLSKIEKAAEREHLSISKWVGKNLQDTLENQYPKGYFQLFGSINDDSFVAEKNESYKDDSEREEL